MFSALKHNGKPLYEYARQGIFIERPSRPITVFDLKVISLENNCVTFTVHCSKGTYVRTIVDDCGELLNCGAHVTHLRRLSVGPYQASQMMTIEQLESLLATDNFSAKQLLLPVDSAVTHWPAITVSESSTKALKQGKSLILPNAPSTGWIRFLDANNEFFGIGEMQSDGKVVPKRLVSL
jgi:tRNA pseudouridine55 synthase